MIDIKTSSGFEVRVSERILKDWRVVKALAKVTTGSDEATTVYAMSDVLALILGKDEERLYKHIMALDDEGIVSSENVMNEAKEIIGAIGEAQKNS